MGRTAGSRLTLAALAAFSSICTLAGASAHAQTDGPRSRAEVIAEVQAARAAGTLGAYSGEDSGSFWLAQQAGTSRPRAEVVAELTAFRESGAMAAQVPEDQFFASHGSPGTRTRAEVVAELSAARAAGELGALHGEDSGSFYIAQHGSAPAATWMAGAATPRGPAAATAQLSQMCASPELEGGGSGTRLADSTR